MKIPFIKSTIEKVVETETIYNENNNIHMKMDVLRIVNMIQCLVGQREIDHNNYDNIMNIILYIVCKSIEFVNSNMSHNKINKDIKIYENFINDLTDQLRNAYCIGYYKLGSSTLIPIMIQHSIKLTIEYYVNKQYDFNKKTDIENLIKKDLLIELKDPDETIQTTNLIVNIYFTLIVSLLSYKHINVKRVKRVLQKIDEDDVQKSCKLLINNSENFNDIDNIIKIFEVNCITLMNLV